MEDKRMAEIRPFSAYRPAPGRESRIAALPYDVYNREEAAEIVRKNPDSFLAIDRAETGFGNEVDTYAPQVYERAAGLFREKTPLRLIEALAITPAMCAKTWLRREPPNAWNFRWLTR